MQGVRQLINHNKHPHNATDTNPFGKALDTPDDIIDELTRNAIKLNPLIKRHIIKGFEGVPNTLQLGWAQLPQTQGKAFSIGLFTDTNHFAQIALADSKARVFAGTDPEMDVQELDPRFIFVKEETLTLPDGPRFGHAANGTPKTVRASQGGVVGRMPGGRMMWLASWLKVGNRYTLEQMRANLPEAMRFDLEYRDAIAIAFFAAYMLPQMNGLLVGFGTGNIFRRLNREAPMGAIRRSIRDTMSARSHGMRASGLEDYFADLMREAGALDKDQGLEAVHGAEPLHLYTSSYSGCYFFAWDSTLPFSASLRALNIEGNLNRFAAVSSWLERNARIGRLPTEDTVTRAEAAQIDMALLENPALIALKPDDEFGAILDSRQDDGVQAVMRLVGIASETRRSIAENTKGGTGGVALGSEGGSEWVYRQTMSRLLRSMRLPYRFDVDFRCSLKDGNMAIGFTSAGVSMMPSTRYDAIRHAWVDMTDAERARMSADYNLRVGLMMAALSFGADPGIQRVSMHIDSIGLEEAVAEQDSAISELMSEALAAFERIRTGDMGVSGSKADPKDGDFHGDPSRPVTSKTADLGSDGGDDDDADDLLNSQFEALMKDIDFDEMAFAVPDEAANESAGEEGDSEHFTHDGLDAGLIGYNDFDGDGDDPLSQLRKNPTVRNLVTVTFTRSEFMERLGECGLSDPTGTYRMFDAEMDVDGLGALKPVDAALNLRDSRFSPAGSQEEPELSDVTFDYDTAQLFGCRDMLGLSIQRVDLLQRAVGEFHRIAQDSHLESVAKAKRAMDVINAIADPELTALAPQVTSALIDGKDTPDFSFRVADELDSERIKARDLLFSGQIDQSVELAEAALERMDQLFASNPGVPRYFNSYAERVIYNRMFATEGERTVLIPDNLFYTHMELADVLAQVKGAKAALPHLNAMVRYAPAYPLSHLKLAVQLARSEDWDPARAACLNALHVALDREDASFAYYRLAYAEWMCDHFDIAAAAYIMSEEIAPGRIAMLEGELQELIGRAQSQCIPVPTNVPEAMHVLAQAGLPVWPNTQVASLVRKTARVCVDEGMFVPARTLSVAASRMDDEERDGADVVQMQFLRSLNN
ncbi:tetratricopeptide repeat protein [Bifidobacterium catenulatum subsp. kashiwanohense]|uniref:tetratricopeptide repeat protein n=1 Tax=Bifidobacterium catenulatum TaxID=1686 RepID=UPI0026F16A47|nr:tetratricopeptide repeat protein [Bifidobacterium catenulatum]